MIIALKPEFYPYIGDRDFTRAWNAELARWKQWRHPFVMARAKAWESDKDTFRKWWFGLSRRERHSWLGRRADGELQNILKAVGFKSPKYQRGMIGGFLASTTSAPSGAVLDLDAANNLAINVDISPPTPLDAGFGALRDGTFDRVNNTGQNQINSGTDWVTPRTGVIGDDFEIKWNAIINPAQINDENYTEDVWVTLSVGTGRGRYVGQSRQVASVASTFELDIGDVGTSTSIVNQNYQVEAGDLI